MKYFNIYFFLRLIYKKKLYYININAFLAQLVEHSAVNRKVDGSKPSESELNIFYK